MSSYSSNKDREMFKLVMAIRGNAHSPSGKSKSGTGSTKSQGIFLGLLWIIVEIEISCLDIVCYFIAKLASW